MSTSSDAKTASTEKKARTSATTLLTLVPLLGLFVTLVEVPNWVKAVAVAVMLAMVAVASRELRRATNGRAWLPSKTLPATASSSAEPSGAAKEQR